MFVQKSRAKNVDEIDTCSQWHQHFTKITKGLQTLTVSIQKLHITLSYQKTVHTNVGEIDNCSKFHQHRMQAVFWANFLRLKKYKTQSVTSDELRTTLLYKKALVKCDVSIPEEVFAGIATTTTRPRCLPQSHVVLKTPS